MNASSMGNMIHPFPCPVARLFKTEGFIKTTQLDQNIGLGLDTTFSTILHFIGRTFHGNRMSKNPDKFLLRLFDGHLRQILTDSLNDRFNMTSSLLHQQAQCPWAQVKTWAGKTFGSMDN